MDAKEQHRPERVGISKGRTMSKVEKTRAGGRWSEAKFFGFIRSALRSASMRWPPKADAIKAARKPYVGPNKRQKWTCPCAVCGQWKQLKDLQADHIVPCGTLRCFADLALFVERLFCEVEGYRILCKPCHKVVTARERARIKAEKGGKV